MILDLKHVEEMLHLEKKQKILEKQLEILQQINAEIKKGSDNYIKFIKTL